MIEAEKVASAILDAATDPTPSTKVGAMSVINTTMAKILPSLGQATAKIQIGRQQRDEPPHSREGTLYRGGESGRVKGRGNAHAADPESARQSNVRSA